MHPGCFFSVAMGQLYCCIIVPASLDEEKIVRGWTNLNNPQTFLKPHLQVDNAIEHAAICSVHYLVRCALCFYTLLHL